MTGNGKRHRIRAAVKRHKTVIIAVGVPLAIPLAVILLVVLLILGVNLKWEVIDPTYWPHQEKTVYRFHNNYSDDGVNVCGVTTGTPDIQVTVYDDEGRQVHEKRDVSWFEVPPKETYTFKARNVTDHWVHANVHECDIEG
ncbi:FxLYD domain-containing protein [Bifidobacterium sp. ESL0769]|uniref:FxLYD domain-containing protein n=1 Tax=Bifidobacterium sp. ESL0769 TaxID=2983229 RepID=UPI0023F9F7E5|nr:FxLYD domain-containing protein [Bifidobacterium sp. ESL0769]WEV67884.1 FxLYD domain-containing protein [Bifidobacterium sp. ESL0769]